MTAPRCIAEPVSWLRLERYHLGELPAAERATVADHLEGCAACRACFARIEADDAGALPPLTLPAKAPARGREDRARRPAWPAGFAALAAAAVVAVVRAPGHVEASARSEASAHAKGGAIAFALVRDDGQRLDDVEGAFRDGDRFKAVVTCPPAAGAPPWFDLAVFDREGASFPLEPAAVPACGNDLPLPGAFRLTGRTHESVCLVWSDDGPIDRAGLSRIGRADLATSPRTVCKELEPSEP